MTETDNIADKQRFFLGKKERLCSEKEIELLFSSGERFIAFPLQVVYRLTDKRETAASVLFSVSKKRFKRAVHRNRIKRLMRERFRLNKHPLYDLLENKEMSISVAFIFVDKEPPDYFLVEKGMLKGIAKLMERLQ